MEVWKTELLKNCMDRAVSSNSGLAKLKEGLHRGGVVSVRGGSGCVLRCPARPAWQAHQFPKCVPHAPAVSTI